MLEQSLSDIGKKDLELPIFSFYNVLAATDNFSVVNKLAEGRLKTVYMVILSFTSNLKMKMHSHFKTIIFMVTAKKFESLHMNFFQYTKLIGCLSHTMRFIKNVMSSTVEQRYSD